MISLGKPESCFFAEKLNTQTNKDSEITGEVLYSFLRGWIGEKPISHTKDVPFFLQSLQIPTVLKKFIMYNEKGPEIDNKDFQLTFKTPYLLKSEYNLLANSGPIFRITENYDIDKPKTVFQ